MVSPNGALFGTSEQVGTGTVERCEAARGRRGRLPPPSSVSLRLSPCCGRQGCDHRLESKGPIDDGAGNLGQPLVVPA
jgi:hypothetical protein